MTVHSQSKLIPVSKRCCARSPCALNEDFMNTLSKVLIVFCAILSTVAFASWSPSTSRNVAGVVGTASAGVALTTSADGKTVYYAHSRDLYKSTDGGETWVMLK